LNPQEVPWKELGGIAAGSVAGVVVLLYALRPYLIRRVQNGMGEKFENLAVHLAAHQAILDNHDAEIRKLRERAHELANDISVLMSVRKSR
jgi:hypothetical protein